MTLVAASVISVAKKKALKNCAPGKAATHAVPTGTTTRSSLTASRSPVMPIFVSVVPNMGTQQIIAKCRRARKA